MSDPVDGENQLAPESTPPDPPTLDPTPPVPQPPQSAPSAPADPAPIPPPTPEALQQLEAKARALQAQYIDKRIQWYRSHTMAPRMCFRWAGIATIVFSVTLPAVASAVFPHKELVLSVMSIGIAALTGLSSFFKWERSWHANSAAQISLEHGVAKWELELQFASLLAPADHANRLYRATNDLMANAAAIVSTESEGFFSGLAFPQQNTAAKP